jgi:hypothetical protein
MDWQLLRCHGRYAEVLHTALVSLMLAVLPALALAAPAIPDTSWPGYNNGLHGERYSPLHAINRGNVNRLQPKCSIEADEPGSLQSGLVVVGDTLFFTTPHTTLAIDAATCALRWRHEFTPTDRDVHPSNRGVAYDQGRVYRGTPDGHLLALDAKTGRELWNINLRDGHPVEYVSAAPLAWKGKVFVATSGGDAGSFLRMLAFDAVTGKELWHFNLTPRDGEFGAESWGSVAEDFRRGASSWSSYALDEHTGEVFISTGNPVPALDGDARPGDNLFTNSVVVFDAESGTRRWHYQVLPADNHDWDLSTPPHAVRDRWPPTGRRQLQGWPPLRHRPKHASTGLQDTNHDRAQSGRGPDGRRRSFLSRHLRRQPMERPGLCAGNTHLVHRHRRPLPGVQAAASRQSGFAQRGIRHSRCFFRLARGHSPRLALRR